MKIRDPFPAPPAPPTLAKGKLVSPQEIVEELEEHIKELQDKLRNDTDAAAYQELANKLALAENRFQRAVRDCRTAGNARDAMHAKNINLVEQLSAAASQQDAKVAALEDLLKNAEDRLRESKAREEEFGARLTSSINQCRGLETQALTDANTILELRKQVESDKKERDRLREILGLEDFAPDADCIPAHVRGLKGKIKDLTEKLASSNAQEVRLNVEVQHLKKALAQAAGVPILAATQQVKKE